MSQAPNMIQTLSKLNLPVITALYFATLLFIVASCLLLMGGEGLLPTMVLFLWGLLFPLLLRYENKLFWLWLLVYPAAFYEPLRLSSFVLGENSNLTIPLFLFLTLPSVLFSFIFRQHEHRTLVSITLPLWFLFVGFLTNFVRWTSLFHPEYLIRDFGFLVITLFFTTIAWRFLSENIQNQRTLFMALFGPGFLNAVVMILQYTLRTGLVDAGGYARPMGLFGFPVEASFAALMTFVLGLYGFFTAQTFHNKLIYSGAIMVALLACLMSLTKTSILHLGLLISLWALFAGFCYGKKALYKVVFASLLFVVLLQILGLGQLGEQLADRFAQKDTFTLRQTLWSIISTNMDLPTLLWGRGWKGDSELLGTYNYNYALFLVDLKSPVGVSAIHTHNVYLGHLFQLGFIGTAMMLGYVWLTLKGLYLTVKNSSTQQRIANLALASSCLTLLFSGLTGNPSEQYFQFYFSIILLYFAHQAGWFSVQKVARG
jgi:hypothetical protein